MRKISTLGPAGSYSEMAAVKYIEQSAEAYEICYYPNIIKTFEAIGRETEEGIIPLENMIDGYIPLALDMLVESQLQIVKEVMVPVNFSYVAHCASFQEVKKLYAQFVTQGQCRTFINQLPDTIKIITTDSNSESYERMKNDDVFSAAIIPAHLASAFPFQSFVPEVADYPNNRTRFVVLAQKGISFAESEKLRTSLVIIESEDKSGSLFEILRSFAVRGLNLSSIISRPNKIEFGKYYFFIDVEHQGYAMLTEAVNEIKAGNIVKILGTYPAEFL